MNNKTPPFLGISIDPPETNTVEDMFWVTDRGDDYMLYVFVPIALSNMNHDDLTYSRRSFANGTPSRALCMQAVIEKSSFKVSFFNVFECWARNVAKLSHDSAREIMAEPETDPIVAEVLVDAHLIATSYHTAAFATGRAARMLKNANPTFCNGMIIDLINILVTNFMVSKNMDIQFGSKVKSTVYLERLSHVITCFPISIKGVISITAPLRRQYDKDNQLQLLGYLYECEHGAPRSAPMGATGFKAKNLRELGSMPLLVDRAPVYRRRKEIALPSSVSTNGHSAALEAAFKQAGLSPPEYVYSKRKKGGVTYVTCTANAIDVDGARFIFSDTASNDREAHRKAAKGLYELISKSIESKTAF